MHADLLGWMAATLMVATFACTQATRLRPLAVATNLAFIGYGAAAGLLPVLVLHLVLLPVNLWRWAQAVALSRQDGRQAAEQFGRLLCLVALSAVPLMAGCGGGEPEEPPAGPPLELVSLKRTVDFTTFRGPQSKPEPGFDPLTRSEPIEFNVWEVLPGPEYNQSLGGMDVRGLARMEVFSTATGMTYWAYAIAPADDITSEPLSGAKIQFEQVQAFRKKSDDATLYYEVNLSTLNAYDDNTDPADESDCPYEVIYKTVKEYNRFGAISSVITLPDYVQTHCDQAIQAHLSYSIVGFYPGTVAVPDSSAFLGVISTAHELVGSQGSWRWFYDDDFNGLPASAFRTVGTDEDTSAYSRAAVVALRDKIPLKMDLSKVPLESIFYVTSKVTARAHNHRYRESGAAAMFRDPAGISGASVTFTGLEPVPVPVGLVLPGELEDPTPECSGAADPARGSIQFEQPEFESLEGGGTSARITLVRGGGSTGEVSVMFGTVDGTATAPGDYTAVNRRVRFREGQTRATVRVPITPDAVAEPRETLALRLSQPRGCAALGDRSEAVLRILDDDHPLPPVSAFTIGGSVTGLAGGTLVLEDRENAAQVNVSADGTFTFNRTYRTLTPFDVRVKQPPASPPQNCTVELGTGNIPGANVTDIVVHCDAPASVSGLDTGFGTFGKVASDLMGSVRAIVRQSSGHLVAISGTRMVRFTPDGRHDAAFGGGKGFVDNLLPIAGGEVFDIAVGPDDRIVVAGRLLQPSRSPPFFQMAAARFLPDGTPDAGFGSGGVATFRMGGPSENARRVLVQPDGRVVLVGQAAFQRVTQVTVTDNDIAIVRLNTDGTLDGSFGSGGAVTADALLLDTALAALLQPDGRIFVAGSTVDSSADPTDSLFARFGADGKYELGFARNPAYSALSDEIVDAALQPDGKIVLLIAARGLNAEVALARINPDGSLDTGFGTNGLVRGDFGPHDDAPRAVALQADGKIVVGAQLSDTVGSPDFALLRYLPDGSLDASFGSGGVMRIDFFGGLGSANDLLVQPDGRIVAAGTARSGLSALATLVRVIP